MTTITLEPARAVCSLSVRASRYLLEFAAEIADELPSIPVIVRYGPGEFDKMALNGSRDEVELF